MKTYVCSFILGITALGGFFHAGAQTNASLNGTVTDRSAAVVQGAKVSVISRETGLRRETATNESGLYEFPLLQPGTYSLTAQKEGLQQTTDDGIRLTEDKNARA